MKKSGLGRLSSLAGTFLKTASSAWWGKLTGRETDGWGALNPKTIDQAVEAFGELKGLPMKLGQILSYVDNALPEKARAAFSVLQRQSKPLPLAEVKSIIAHELQETGAELVAAMEPTPIASASIGQVYRARLKSGQELAVKVQYPGIAEAISAEMKIAASGASLARIFAPGAAVDLLVAEVRDRLLEECDYRNEAQNQNLFYQFFREHPTIAVPPAHLRYSSKMVITSDWVNGSAFDTWLAQKPSQEQRNQIGAALYEFYITSLYRYGMFNADPHPGNYIISEKQIWFLDYGCVRKFSAERIGLMRQLSAAVQVDKKDEILQAMYALGMNQPLHADYAGTRRLLRGFFAPILTEGPRAIEAPSATGFSDMLTSKNLLLSLGLPADVLFLIRIKYGLYSILGRLGAKCDWHQLEAVAARTATGS